MKEIKLTKGKVAIVDDEDYEYLNQWKWHWGNPGYARRIVNASKLRGVGKTKHILMHREIVKPLESEFIDHIDRNGLNNCRSNLRICTHQQNSFNRRRLNPNHLKGAHLYKNLWSARIAINGKIRYLGSFPNEHLAALAYDLWAVDLHGEYADTNFKIIN